MTLAREINPGGFLSQPDGDTRFGESVAIDGMIAVIGMPGKKGYVTLQSDNANVGAVYVLKGDGNRKTRSPQYPRPVVRWDMRDYGEEISDGNLTTGLPVIPDVRKDGEFGKSVSISGDKICVGQPGGGSGDVYVYKHKLVNTDTYHYGASKTSVISNDP